MDRRAEIEKALREGKALPAGPAVIARIAEISRDPNASARDLGKVLQLDGALTSRVLKQVNSSFYGLSATIKTVTHAVVILGFQEIKHLALSVPVANLYEDNRGRPGIDVSALWRRTVETACLGRTLSYHVRHQVPEQVFISGILSNTGVVVLNTLLGTTYADVVRSSMDEEDLPRTERDMLGIDHVEVGRLLAERWKFPPELINTIARQFDPVGPDGAVMREAGLLFCARRIRSAMQAGPEADLALARIPERLQQEFALTSEAIAVAWDKASREFDAALAMLSAD